MTEGRRLEVRGIELREVALPLVRPFRTSFGEETDKRAILVRVDAGDVEGWGANCRCAGAIRGRRSSMIETQIDSVPC